MRGCSCRGTACFAHVSCLAEQAKILVAEAEENNLDLKAKRARWARWNTCSLCEQRYHGLVAHALGWACWKTYVGRAEADMPRQLAMGLLGVGLYQAKYFEDALSVREVTLSMARRLGGPAAHILIIQGNLATNYQMLGWTTEGLRMRRDVYAGTLRLYGEENEHTLIIANNYAMNLLDLRRFEEVK